MELQGISASQRRALNQVWTGAEKYGFEPRFLAFERDGSPELYMNCVVGLVHKWYGEAMPAALFGLWAGDRRQTVLDDLAWLALENAAFERELPGRPVLAALRADHARAFFEAETTLSRQEWMAKNQMVYALESARWKWVLGQRPPVLTPREKALDRALRCSGTLTAEELSAAIRTAFHSQLGFDGKSRPPRELHLHLSERWAPLLTKLLPTELHRTDDLALGRSAAAGQGRFVKAARGLRERLLNGETPAEDRAYIEGCFGPCRMNPSRLALTEQRLCTGGHLGCRLWFSDGLPSVQASSSPEARRLAEQARQQARKNRDAYAKSIDLYQNEVRRLTEQIRNSLLIHQQPGAETARQGCLNGALVWRQAAVGDGRVFLRPAPEDRPGFTVDLLLDGSASRLQCQESIAAQGYMLAESLGSCGIPVRVSSFCSLRGYTVLRVLKEYADKNGDRKIFEYFAAGWNRDGLALRAMGELLKTAPAEKHLLVLLTDASPNDSRRFAAAGALPLEKPYEGRAGVEDAAAEVRALRSAGVRVAAVFMGESVSVPDAKLIFGRDLARIRRADDLAMAAGRLIQEEIRELSG